MRHTLVLGFETVFALLVISTFVPEAQAWQAPATEKPQAKTATGVELSIRFADGKTRRFEPIAWHEGMTVLDLMQSCKGSDGKALKFEHRGSGATAFLTSIDGVANESGRGSKAWIFRVNDKLGNRSFGTTELKPGDTVLWHFGKYEPE